MRFSPLVRWFARVAAGVLLAAFVIAPAMAAPERPIVVDPDNKVLGRTYADWSARWWQWAFSLPTDEHPLFDTAPPSEGRIGKVLFLGGTFTTTETPGGVFGEADRSVTVKPGTYLYFPILNTEASDIEGNGETEAELRESANFLMDFVDPDDLFLRIDGQQVEDLEPFRVESPLFKIKRLPEGNLLGVPAGTSGIAVSDGYYVMLNPLPVGEHVIEFGGFVDLSSIGGPLFTLAIKYTVTVAR